MGPSLPCPGADPGFSLGGGGVGGGAQKIMCPHALYTSAEPNSLSAGIQGPLKGSGSHLQSQNVRLDKNNGMYK